jgi:four helix bundle protein
VERSRYEDLIAYQRSRALAEALWIEVSGWKSFERWSVGVQLVRAADSVAANIAEAYGRWSILDQRRMLHIARGSLFETSHWVSIAAARGLLDPAPTTPLLDEAKRTLSGLIRSLGS